MSSFENAMIIHRKVQLNTKPLELISKFIKTIANDEQPHTHTHTHNPKFSPIPALIELKV